MQKLVYRAFAKINLLLDVVGRRADGYHNLVMLNQSIDMCDTVTVEKVQNQGIHVACDCKGIPLDEGNIVYRACNAFALYSDVSIVLEKRIPTGAGLAGGSADAAAVLAALNQLYSDPTRESLYSIAAQVGADVPFCLMGGSCLAEGIGEALTPLPPLPNDYLIALVKPEISISTAEAYAALDKIDIIHPPAAQAIALAKRGHWEAAFPLCANVFEQVTALPGLAEAKRRAMDSGALLTQMTGSGSAVFSIFHKDINPGGIVEALRILNKNVKIYRPVPYGVRVIENE